MVWLDIISSADARSRSRLRKTGGYLTESRSSTSFTFFTSSPKTPFRVVTELGCRDRSSFSFYESRFS